MSLQNLAKGANGNVLISPLAIELALILLYEGSYGVARQEIANAMSLPYGLGATRDKYMSAVRSLLKTNPDYELDFGSSIYIDNEFALRQRYMAVAQSFYDTRVFGVPFKDAVKTAQIINRFFQYTTRGHIQSVVDGKKHFTVCHHIHIFFYRCPLQNRLWLDPA